MAMIVTSAVLVAACGSSSNGGSGGGSATVVVRKVTGYGKVLATPSGQTLYLLTSDPSGGSKCTGSCTAKWPPLTQQGKPTAGSGVDGSLLSTFKRSDGKVQVVYNKHALYTHTGSGAASGAGTVADGGVWYMVSPSGNAVKSTSGGSY